MEGINLHTDRNGMPTPLAELSGSHDIDGTDVSTMSAAIEGWAVRIQNLGNTFIRVAFGAEPEADMNDIAIAPYGTLCYPVGFGDRVAVIGGAANISTIL